MLMHQNIYVSTKKPLPTRKNQSIDNLNNAALIANDHNESQIPAPGSPEEEERLCQATKGRFEYQQSCRSSFLDYSSLD
ncbi:hypothetical protein KIN20_008989 [Parelaphostrongylus tenuis]|uniref:Uncharacterized protein n=1 Tax=Parelaphostrongylus tenuis TaxID=148309 RepID=A0AAD5MPY8_PARTN|nr:hypothetical protein KIN20_008989 [Parelaphostrongylus tenuis]